MAFIGQRRDFLQKKHAKYFQRCLQILPARYASIETSRMTAAFFAISGLDMLNCLDVIEKDSAKLVEWIYSLQVLPNADGTNLHQCGFRGSPTLKVSPDVILDNPSAGQYDSGHVAMTYTALLTLLILGDDLARVNPHGVLAGVKHLQKTDGSFCSTSEGSENDMRFVYCAACICYILEDWSGMDRNLTLQYIMSSLTYEGAFAQGPDLEAHGGSTYCAVASLVLMGCLHTALSPRQLDRLRRWCVLRQESGFQGRPNKPVDTCYSFWVGATLQLLDMYQLTDPQCNRSYLLDTQDPLVGGFSKWPDNTPDPLHAYFGICGLSLLGEPLLKPMHPSLNVSLPAADCLERLQQAWGVLTKSGKLVRIDTKIVQMENLVENGSKRDDSVGGDGGQQNNDTGNNENNETVTTDTDSSKILQKNTEKMTPNPGEVNINSEDVVAGCEDLAINSDKLNPESEKLTKNVSGDKSSLCGNHGNHGDARTLGDNRGMFSGCDDIQRCIGAPQCDIGTPLLRDKHVQFFLRCLGVLPPECQSIDSSRMTIVCFAVSALDMMNSVDAVNKAEILKWIYSLQVTDKPTDNDHNLAGFSGSPFLKQTCADVDTSHLAMTFFALCSLLVLRDDLSRVERYQIITSLKHLQMEEGCFRPCASSSQTDIKFIYWAISICYMLNDWSSINVHTAVRYIQQCKTYEGGFGQGPGSEAHGGATFCAVASLWMMGYLHQALDPQDLHRLRRWCLARQDAGFSGRTSKVQDVSYTFWDVATLQILGSYKSLDSGQARSYVKYFQCQESGGFIHKQAKIPDHLTSYFGVACLSLLRESGMKSLHPALNISHEAVQHLKYLHYKWADQS